MLSAAVQGSIGKTQSGSLTAKTMWDRIVIKTDKLHFLFLIL